MKHLDLDFSKYATIPQLSKELNYYSSQCLNALESSNIQPITVCAINYYPKKEAIEIITKFRECAKSHRTSSLENGIKNILLKNKIKFLENTKPIKSPITNRPLE